MEDPAKASEASDETVDHAVASTALTTFRMGVPLLSQVAHASLRGIYWLGLKTRRRLRGYANLVLAVDNAGAPASNAAGSEVTEAAAETIAPVALAVAVCGHVFGVAIAPGDGGHLRDGLRLLVVCVLCSKGELLDMVSKPIVGD